MLKRRVRSRNAPTTLENLESAIREEWENCVFAYNTVHVRVRRMETDEGRCQGCGDKGRDRQLDMSPSH
ncbi:hypothetical protein EVAR_21896_1 [Eumeta japonica]|uniref:Uncharacterized protein n=1 Tax=Eumeta variegata TaxID=151549 RepID=A0A4C2A9X8_EUMVA|nr:hypothetical protein EVAR_21896_1 [Eumeta japonica]